MSCISVSLERIGGSAASLERVGSCEMCVTRAGKLLSAGATRVGGSEMSATLASRATCRMALVCGTSLGRWYLYASDGILITIDNGYLMVKKTEN